MALGSFATATNVSPMPTARAPMPMRRNVADDVPARWPPSEACANAVAGASNATSVTSMANRANGRRGPDRARARRAGRMLEVRIKLQLPLRAGSIVGRVIHLAHLGVVGEPADVVRVVLPLPPDAAEAGDRIDAIVDVVVEQVRGRDAEVETAGPGHEPAVQLEVRRVLHRRVLRIRQADRVDAVDVERRVRASGLALHVDVQAHAARPAHAAGRPVVVADVEAGGELAGAIPAHELLGQPLLGVAAELLQRAFLVGVAALAARLLV